MGEGVREGGDEGGCGGWVRVRGDSERENRI